MSNMTLEQLQRKIELWKKSWPELVKIGLQGGTSLLQKEIQRRWSGGELQTRSGALVRAVKTQVKLNPLTAKVYVDSRQQYKAQTFENGKTIIAAEGARSQKRAKLLNKEAFLQIGPSRYGNYYYGRPRQVTIAARPVFHPSLEAKRQEITDSIKKKILEGYKYT